MTSITAALLGICIGLIGLAFIILYSLALHFNWACVFGRHQYQLAGRRHGMTRTATGVKGSTRAIYKCTGCGKEKPAELGDYE